MRLQIDVDDGVMETISAYAEANDVRLRRIVTEALRKWIDNPTLKVFRPSWDKDAIQNPNTEIISDYDESLNM